MSWFVLGLVPILIFVIADVFFSDKQAILISIVVGLIAVIVAIQQTGFDPLFLLDFGLLFGFGVVAIMSKNTRYFKLQPAILSFLLALILLCYQIFANGYMIRFMPLVQKNILLYSPQGAAIDWEHFRVLLDKGEKASVVTLFIHSGLIVWLSKKANKYWVMGKIAAFPLLAIGMLIAWII